MDTKKLSRSVRKRLNKKGIRLASSSTVTKSPEKPIEEPQSTFPITTEPTEQPPSRKKLAKKQENSVKSPSVTKVTEGVSESENQPTSQKKVTKNPAKGVTQSSVTVTESPAGGSETENQPTSQEKVAKNPAKSVTKPPVTITEAPERRGESANQPTSTTKRNWKRDPDNKVVYINSNYGGGDPNSVGARIQAEMIELRNQSHNIKSASDLTQSQAHVVKRQITRLHGGEKERVFKRPKHWDQTVGEAAKELMQLMEKQKTERAAPNAKQ